MDEILTLDQVLDQSVQLSVPDQLRLISLLAQRLRGHIGDNGEPIDILSTIGLGAELWQEIDTDAYLEQERASWDN
jgi:hypothetical protein